MTLDFIESAAGAVLIEMGKTRVICTVSIEDKVPSFLVGSGSGWLTAVYGMLPGSSGKRIPRESSTGKVNGRTREIQRLIGRRSDPHSICHSLASARCTSTVTLSRLTEVHGRRQ